MFIQAVENHLLANLKGNDDSELLDCQYLISIKYWIGAREHLLKLLNEDVKKCKQEELKRLWTRKDDEFPNIRFLAFDRTNTEEFAVLMINLNVNTRLRMTIMYSDCEDFIIYVDVQENSPSVFDWKNLLNIDSKVERNVVLKVNATLYEDPTGIAEQCVNDPFFDNLFKMLDITEPTPFEVESPTPFGVLLWKYGYEERVIYGNNDMIQNVEFERRCEIYEERWDPLVKIVNLDQINELKVFEYAWKKANRIYTKKREENCNNTTSDISVSNVNGRLVIVDLYRAPRFVTEISFNLKFKESEFIVNSNFELEFESEIHSPCRVSILNCTSVRNPALRYQFHVFPNETSLIWVDSCLSLMGEESPIDLTIPPNPFENDQQDLQLIFEKVLRIVPRYCLFNSDKNLSIPELLKFFVGNESFITSQTSII